MSASATWSSSPGAASPPDPDKATARSVAQMFGSIAARYDLLNHLLSLGVDIRWRKLTARAFEPTLSQPGTRVLDLCTGTADLALALARRSRARVIAADFSRPMLQRGREKARRSRLPIHILEADALELPFAAEVFDLITLAFGFRNLVNYKVALREIRRVLKRGGQVGILEFSQIQNRLLGPLFHFYFHRVLPQVGSWISGVRGPYQYLVDSVGRFPDPDSLAKVLEECGFVEVSYRRLTGGIAALHRARKPP